MNAAGSAVICETHGAVALVRLNREQKGNAFGAELSRAFATLLDQLDADEGVRAVVLTGSGYLPVRNSAYELPAAKDIIARYPDFQLPADLFAKTTTTAAALGPVLGPFAEVREAMVSAMESMLAGGASADEAIETAAQEGNAAISEYNRRLGH